MSEKIDYINVNGYNKTYEIVNNTGIDVSVDYSEEIWAERYRPRIPSDLILEKSILDRIENYIEEGTIPNLLFYSIAGGSGKDSIVSVLNNSMESDIKVINASMYRNVSDVKDMIMGSVTKNSVTGDTRWIYISEIGGMNKAAVDSLKAVIEENSHVRFIVTTNSLDNLSDPFLSRFKTYDMNTISKDSRKELLKKTILRVVTILRNENIEFEMQDVKDLVINTFPSYREMMVTLKDNVIGDKFKLVTSTQTDEIEEFLSLINDKAYEAVVKKADTINVPNILRYMNLNKTKVLENSEDIPDLIFELNILQEALNKHVAFPAISLTVFAMKLMNSEVKFKLD